MNSQLESDECYQEFLSFHREHGHAQVPLEYRHNGVCLGSWVRNLRAKHQKGKLSPEDVERLNELGFIWNYREYMDEKINQLRDFKVLHGHIELNEQDQPELYRWLSVQQCLSRQGKLFKQYKGQLRDLGVHMPLDLKGSDDVKDDAIFEQYSPRGVSSSHTKRKSVQQIRGGNKKPKFSPGDSSQLESDNNSSFDDHEDEDYGPAASASSVARLPLKLPLSFLSRPTALDPPSTASSVDHNCNSSHHLIRFTMAQRELLHDDLQKLLQLKEMRPLQASMSYSLQTNGAHGGVKEARNNPLAALYARGSATAERALRAAAGNAFTSQILEVVLLLLLSLVASYLFDAIIWSK